MLIKTKQFTIRKYKLSDAYDLFMAIKDKDIIKNLAVVPYPYKKSDAIDFLKKCLKNYNGKNPKSINYCIEIDNQFAGAIGVGNIIPGHKGEIGYWLAKKYWGKGLMTKIIRVFTNYLFRKYKLRKIEATVFSFNPASKRVLEKCGFKEEGFLKKHYKKGNKFIDAYWMGKVK